MKQSIFIWVKRRLVSVCHALPLIVAPILCALVSTVWAEEKIPVFPQSNYEAHIIYQNLAIFWFFIIGLIVIIRMKLKEIERTQKMGVDKDDEKAPQLE